MTTYRYVGKIHPQIPGRFTRRFYDYIDFRNACDPARGVPVMKMTSGKLDLVLNGHEKVPLPTRNSEISLFFTVRAIKSSWNCCFDVLVTVARLPS